MRGRGLLVDINHQLVNTIGQASGWHCELIRAGLQRLGEGAHALAQGIEQHYLGLLADGSLQCHAKLAVGGGIRERANARQTIAGLYGQDAS